MVKRDRSMEELLERLSKELLIVETSPFLFLLFDFKD